VGIWGALALLSHTNAMYTYASAAVLALSWTVSSWRLGRKQALEGLGRLVLPVAFLSALAAVAYLPQLRDLEQIRAKWSDTPPIALTFLPAMFSNYFGAGFLTCPTLLMLIYAAWRACRNGRQSQWMLLAVMTAIGSISLAGVSHFPRTYARFLIATLPWLILVIADGCTTIALNSRKAAGAALLLLVACSLVALNTDRQQMRMHPWQQIVHALRDDIAAGEQCLLVGPVGANTALHVYGVACHRNAAEALSGLPLEDPTRLAIVLIPDEINVDLPSRAYGTVRIITMAGRPREIAATLSRALIAGANDRVVGGLAEVYQQIGILLRWIGPQDTAAKYDRLARSCQMQADRFRELPPQLVEDASIVPNY